MVNTQMLLGIGVIIIAGFFLVTFVLWAKKESERMRRKNG